jgi:hypothetical protein
MMADDSTIENITITGCTNGISGSNKGIFEPKNGKTLVFNNVELSNIFRGSSTSGRIFYTYGYSSKIIMTNVIVISNTQGLSEYSYTYAYMGNIYITDCTIPGCGAYNGSLIISGVNNMMGKNIVTLPNSDATGKVYVISGSTIADVNKITIGNASNFISIGNFNEQNEWVEGGTAVIISGGTTFVVSGTGTYLDRTQTPITDLTIVS